MNLFTGGRSKHHLVCSAAIGFTGRVQNFDGFRLICMGKSRKIQKNSDLQLWDYAAQHIFLLKI